MEEDNWNTVSVQNEEPEQIEIEFEEPQEQQKSKIEAQKEETSQEEAPELDGIATNGATRRIKKLLFERQERDKHIQALIQKNEELNTNLRTKDKEVNTLGKTSLDASQKQLTDKIELARSVYTEAFEEGDKDRVLKAQEMLNDAQIDLKAVTAAQNNYQEIEEQVVPQQAQPQLQRPQRTDPRAEKWAADNDWFGTDNVMTAAALAIDAELKGEGYDPEDQDFYKEINKRVKSAFPHKFGEDQNRVQETIATPAQVVSGGSRSSPTNSKKVKLSKEDVRLAQKWDIPLERYAAEKLKVDNSDGYTNIT
tara:strand:+ start:136 stop:1062 length:927 start_codon:yes stop_codon:yes gene_type:complete